MSQSCNWKPIFLKVIHYVNQSLKRLNAVSTPPTKYSVKLFKWFSFVWYVIPLVLVGAILLLSTNFNVLMMKNINKNRCRYVPFMLLDIILAQWPRPVASTKALYLLLLVMHAVSYRCNAAAIKMTGKVSQFFCFVCCYPGGCMGDTEQVVTRWQHPVASRVALGMPHWAIPSVLLRCTAMAIKMANDGGAFVCHRRLFCMIICSYKIMLWSIKTNTELQY